MTLAAIEPTQDTAANVVGFLGNSTTNPKEQLQNDATNCRNITPPNSQNQRNVAAGKG
jgi:hypothetical protein